MIKGKGFDPKDYIKMSAGKKITESSKVRQLGTIGEVSPLLVDIKEKNDNLQNTIESGIGSIGRTSASNNDEEGLNNIEENGSNQTLLKQNIEVHDSINTIDSSKGKKLTPLI